MEGLRPRADGLHNDNNQHECPRLLYVYSGFPAKISFYCQVHYRVLCVLVSGQNWNPELLRLTLQQKTNDNPSRTVSSRRNHVGRILRRYYMH